MCKLHCQHFSLNILCSDASCWLTKKHTKWEKKRIFMFSLQHSQPTQFMIYFLVFSGAVIFQPVARGLCLFPPSSPNNSSVLFQSEGLKPDDFTWEAFQKFLTTLCLRPEIQSIFEEWYVMQISTLPGLNSNLDSEAFQRWGLLFYGVRKYNHKFHKTCTNTPILFVGSLKC